MQEAPLNGERIIEIEIERLKDFKNNPFKIREDTELEQLMSSVERYGVLCPLIVRPTLDATYEIISGHRRKYVERLPGIAARAIEDACTGSNPRQPSQEEMEKLLKCCYYDTEVDF